MAVKNYIQISSVPNRKRLLAQERARIENISAVPLSNDQFRVKASRGYHNVLSRDAILNADYYEVRTYDSDGELFATCSCPFGERGDASDTNICKHIEAALKVRPVPYKAPAAPRFALPVFESGKITIDIRRNALEVQATRTSTDGFTNPSSRRRRLDVAGGERAFTKLLEFIDNTF